MTKMTVLFFLFSASGAFAGNELGNGGDLVAQEFIAAGRKLVQELRAKPDPRIADVEKLAEAVETVKVSTAESLTLHGNEVDAINFPEEKHIDVSRSRWRESTPGKRASLVLHEYLGILEIDDKQYEISGSYAEAFAIPEEKPKKWEAALGSSYGFANSIHSFGHFKSRSSSQNPGVSVFFGRKLSDRVSLGLKFDRQTFGYEGGWGHSESTVMELMASMKYWLQSQRTWRPYVQFGVGLAQSKSTSVYQGPNPFDSFYYQSPYTDREVAFQLGAGYRYALMRDIGLDLGAQVHNYGGPWDKWSAIAATGKVGLDVQF